jgi:hypothetical protein
MQKKTKFIVRETVTRVYELYAEDMDAAIDAAYEIDDSWDHHTEDGIIESITDAATGKEVIF